MSSSKKNTVVGVFRTRASAESAFDALQSYGIPSSNISVLMSDKTRSRDWAHEKAGGTSAGSKAAEGMGVGGAIGTAVGATIAAIAAVGTSIVLPGLGLVVAGPIAAALAGGGAGALTGGLIGGLVGLGIPEADAQVYNDALRDGGVVIGVTPKDSSEAREVEKIMKNNSGEQVCQC